MKATSYKNRRIASAIALGFKRIGRPGTKREKSSLTRKLSLMWDKSIGRPCIMCDRKLTAKTSSFCHDVALSQGGSHTADNIYLACQRCNRSQHTLSLTEYMKLQAWSIKTLGIGNWVKIRAWLAGSRY